MLTFSKEPMDLQKEATKKKKINKSGAATPRQHLQPSHT